MVKNLKALWLTVAVVCRDNSVTPCAGHLRAVRSHGIHKYCLFTSTTQWNTVYNNENTNVVVTNKPCLVSEQLEQHHWSSTLSVMTTIKTNKQRFSDRNSKIGLFELYFQLHFSMSTL